MHKARKKATSAQDKSDLQRIPGIGKQMEDRLLRLGCANIASLKTQDPEALYEADCRQHGGSVDRCVLYVYRLAVYFAQNKQHEPEKLKWWYWKDKDARLQE